MRFLGRKVYLGVIAVLTTALNHELTDQHRNGICQRLQDTGGRKLLRSPSG